MSAVSQPDHLLGGRVSLPPSADIGRRDNEVRRGGGHGQREKGPPAKERERPGCAAPGQTNAALPATSSRRGGPQAVGVF